MTDDPGLCHSSYIRPDWLGFAMCCLSEGHTNLHVGHHPHRESVMVDWAEQQAYRLGGEGRCQAIRLDGLRCEGRADGWTRHLGEHWATVHGEKVYWNADWSTCPERVQAADPTMGAEVIREKLAEKGIGSAGTRQVGGDHYSKHQIQPWDVVDEYNLGYYEGNVLKYLLRRKTNRLEDLQKARHYLDKAIERVQAEENTKEG